jgi:hypothetical protein
MEQLLPVELLSEIFINSKSFENEPSFLRRPPGPLLLGQICSRWRRIAHHLTPRLWTDLDVSLSHCIGDNIIFIHDWLARAGVLPLSIRIESNRIYNSSSGNDNDVDQHKLANVLTHFLTRTKTLRLQLPSSYIVALGASIPAGGMPLLDYLSIDVDDEILPSPLGVDLSMITLEGCHNLRYLDVTLVGSTFEHQLVKTVPWSQLVNLIVWDAGDLSLANTIFHISSSLVDCILEIGGWPLYPPNIISNSSLTGVAATHPHLRHLSIAFSDAEFCVVTPFLQIISPALEELALDYDPSVSSVHESPTNAILALKDRSSFMLTKLELGHIHLTSQAPQFVTLFDNLPTLTSLNIEYCHFLNQEMISALIYFVDMPPILPNLTEFSVCEEEINIGDDLVLDMIESRWTFQMEGATSRPEVRKLEEVSVFVQLDSDSEMEDPPLSERPSSLTCQRGEALLCAGLRLRYPRLKGDWQNMNI